MAMISSLAKRNSFLMKSSAKERDDAEAILPKSYEVPGSYASLGARPNFCHNRLRETGRPVSRVASHRIFLRRMYFGIHNDWATTITPSIQPIPR